MGNGPRVTAEVTQTFIPAENSPKIVTVLERRQTNGLLERQNRTLIDPVRAIHFRRELYWDPSGSSDLNIWNNFSQLHCCYAFSIFEEKQRVLWDLIYPSIFTGPFVIGIIHSQHPEATATTITTCSGKHEVNTMLPDKIILGTFENNSCLKGRLSYKGFHQRIS